MEHFDDIEDQVSISIDENEIPFPKSNDDSFYSSVCEEFGAFKSNGLARIEEGNKGYEMIQGCIAQCGLSHIITERILKHTQGMWIDNHLTDDSCNWIFSRQFYQCLHHIVPIFVHGKRDITPYQFLQHTCHDKRRKNLVVWSQQARSLIRSFPT